MMEPEEKKFAAQIPYWHHVDCFILLKTDLGADNFGASDLPGFYDLLGLSKKNSK